MHDIDRTQRELEMEHEHELGHEHEHEHEHEAEGEAFLGALFGEAEHEHEMELETEHEAESPLSETQEMELASELLEVSNETELEYFLGNLFKSAARGVGNFIRSPTGRALGGMLKGVAKKALPIAGRALGTYFGGPLGGQIGGKLGGFASNLFEMELEGLSHEDREFEVARRVVRLGAAAARRAVALPRTAPPKVRAVKALKSAARVYAPGLLRVRRGGVGGCATCGKRYGRKRMFGSGGPTYVRGTNGSTRYFGGGGPVVGGPVAIPDGVPSDYADPATYAADPSYAEPSDYPVATRGGRWFRRGRHIVLTGL
jgi:hypothetical protein